MTDIVERLRVEWQDIGDLPCIDDMNSQRAAAADEIERLRAALKPFAARADQYEKNMGDPVKPALVNDCKAARKALKGET